MSAATDPVGGLLAQTSVSADAAGYRRLLEFAQARVPGRRCWAVEGAGSYGAGLAAFLQARGERVVEVGRPKRPLRRSGAKSDAPDASGRRGKRWPKTTCWRRVARGSGGTGGAAGHPPSAGPLR